MRGAGGNQSWTLCATITVVNLGPGTPGKRGQWRFTVAHCFPPPPPFQSNHSTRIERGRLTGRHCVTSVYRMAGLRGRVSSPPPTASRKSKSIAVLLGLPDRCSLICITNSANKTPFGSIRKVGWLRHTAVKTLTKADISRTTALP